MIIQYFPGNKRPSVYCDARIEHIILHPGDNEISFDDWMLIKKHPHYKDERNNGVIVEIAAKPTAKVKADNKSSKEARKETRKERKHTKENEKVEVTKNADI